LNPSCDKSAVWTGICSVLRILPLTGETANLN